MSWFRTESSRHVFVLSIVEYYSAFYDYQETLLDEFLVLCGRHLDALDMEIPAPGDTRVGAAGVRSTFDRHRPSPTL